ncbi:hypothetical protein F2P45_13325 [Massilia sp. CCM 8733]|uniref:Uncharacterized protein n=1 Tax=Massilia mucilaginosa TaxID=2609282 RepID=A0ABX0NT47_9BURK|nr:hypothetical protein [Massilia mucilaginosa]NHZ89987.1 hypothetical protein [Massilia mucilaginosa]
MLIKIVQNAQRRHVNRLLAEDIGDALAKSIARAIYFPDSSDILQQAMAMLGDERATKQTFFVPAYHLIDEKALSAIASLPDLPAVLCFFPTCHANSEYVSSDLPVMEIARASAANWYRFNASRRDQLSFFFCIAPDFSCGMIMDVCAGDPMTSGSDDPIYELYSWDAGKR